MSTLKTLVTTESVNDFLQSVPDEQKRNDSFVLLELFKNVTKEEPKMWGTSIVGFGMYHYKSERSTQEGDWPLTGFSPRKQSLTLYVNFSFPNCLPLLSKLGKHTKSVGCLYIKRLSDVDMDVLKEILTASYELNKKTLTSR